MPHARPAAATSPPESEMAISHSSRSTSLRQLAKSLSNRNARSFRRCLRRYLARAEKDAIVIYEPYPRESDLLAAIVPWGRVPKAFIDPAEHALVDDPERRWVVRALRVYRVEYARWCDNRAGLFPAVGAKEVVVLVHVAGDHHEPPHIGISFWPPGAQTLDEVLKTQATDYDLANAIPSTAREGDTTGMLSLEETAHRHLIRKAALNVGLPSRPPALTGW